VEDHPDQPIAAAVATADAGLSALPPNRYNQARTHLALQKDAPLRESVSGVGNIIAIPILSGLHHQYVRM
jgi:hypothetical protein